MVHDYANKTFIFAVLTNGLYLIPEFSTLIMIKGEKEV